MVIDKDAFTAKNWTWEDYDYLCKHHLSKSTIEIGEALQRSPISVQEKLKGMGLMCDDTVTTTDAKVYKQYSDNLGAAIVFALPRVSVRSLEVLHTCVKNAV